MVVFVLDRDGEPVAARMVPATVVRDGLVLDFIGAVDGLKAIKRDLEELLQIELRSAITGYPPGVPRAERQAMANVLESAGLTCAGLVDEPTAANRVLQIRDGAIVDVGGGNTGIAILEEGEVTYTADEATGGTHFNLVIAGALGIAYEAAESLKEDPLEQPRLLGLVRPVMEKVGTIISNHLQGHSVAEITLVGGASAFLGMADVISESTGLPTHVAPHCQLVTPLGLALSGSPTEPTKATSGIASLWSRT
jgi:ethanolamine utilization protein EutJ